LSKIIYIVVTHIAFLLTGRFSAFTTVTNNAATAARSLFFCKEIKKKNLTKPVQTIYNIKIIRSNP